MILTEDQIQKIFTEVRGVQLNDEPEYLTLLKSALGQKKKAGGSDRLSSAFKAFLRAHQQHPQPALSRLAHQMAMCLAESELPMKSNDEIITVAFKYLFPMTTDLHMQVRSLTVQDFIQGKYEATGTSSNKKITPIFDLSGIISEIDKLYPESNQAIANLHAHSVYLSAREFIEKAKMNPKNIDDLIQSLSFAQSRTGFTGSPQLPFNQFVSNFVTQSIDETAPNALEKFWKTLYPNIQSVYPVGKWPQYGEAILDGNRLINYRMICGIARENNSELKRELNRFDAPLIDRIVSFVTNHEPFWMDFFRMEPQEEIVQSKNYYDFFAEMKEILFKYSSERKADYEENIPAVAYSEIFPYQVHLGTLTTKEHRTLTAMSPALHYVIMNLRFNHLNTTDSLSTCFTNNHTSLSSVLSHKTMEEFLRGIKIFNKEKSIFIEIYHGEDKLYYLTQHLTILNDQDLETLVDTAINHTDRGIGMDAIVLASKKFESTEHPVVSIFNFMHRLRTDELRLEFLNSRFQTPEALASLNCQTPEEYRCFSKIMNLMFTDEDFKSRYIAAANQGRNPPINSVNDLLSEIRFSPVGLEVFKEIYFRNSSDFNKLGREEIESTDDLLTICEFLGDSFIASKIDSMESLSDIHDYMHFDVLYRFITNLDIARVYLDHPDKGEIYDFINDYYCENLYPRIVSFADVLGFLISHQGDIEKIRSFDMNKIRSCISTPHELNQIFIMIQSRNLSQSGIIDQLGADFLKSIIKNNIDYAIALKYVNVTEEINSLPAFLGEALGAERLYSFIHSVYDFDQVFRVHYPDVLISIFELLRNRGQGFNLHNNKISDCVNNIDELSYALNSLDGNLYLCFIRILSPVKIRNIIQSTAELKKILSYFDGNVFFEFLTLLGGEKLQSLLPELNDLEWLLDKDVDLDIESLLKLFDIAAMKSYIKNIRDLKSLMSHADDDIEVNDILDTLNDLFPGLIQSLVKSEDDLAVLLNGPGSYDRIQVIEDLKIKYNPESLLFACMRHGNSELFAAIVETDAKLVGFHRIDHFPGGRKYPYVLSPSDVKKVHDAFRSNISVNEAPQRSIKNGSEDRMLIEQPKEPSSNQPIATAAPLLYSQSYSVPPERSIGDLRNRLDVLTRLAPPKRNVAELEDIPQQDAKKLRLDPQ